MGFWPKDYKSCFFLSFDYDASSAETWKTPDDLSSLSKGRYAPQVAVPRIMDLLDRPHISTPHIETTMPNKIFQFMLLGKPVVVSSTRPMMRVVRDARCGLIFQERDAASLAETIVKLKDADLRRQLGENGKRAVRERYNWRRTVQALLEIYRKLSLDMRER